MIHNAALAEFAHPVLGLASVVPSTSSPAYVSLKNYNRISIVILVKNATTVTGSAITLKQATAVAGTGEKALSFDSVWVNTDCAAGDTLTKTAVSSDTFTTNSTNSKNLMYIIDIKAEQLDVNNAFDCIRAAVGDATAATVTIFYLLRNSRFEGVTPPTAVAD